MEGRQVKAERQYSLKAELRANHGAEIALLRRRARWLAGFAGLAVLVAIAAGFVASRPSRSVTEAEQAARVALGDIEPTAVPRYQHREGNDTWVYMDPQRNFRSTPLAASR